MLGDSAPTNADFMQAREQRVCEPCVVGKMQRPSHPLRSPRATPPCWRIYADLCEFPIEVAQRGGLRYFLVVVDEATRFALVTPLKRKSDAASAMREAIAWLETQTGMRVVRVRTDRGGEFLAGALLAWYRARGTQQEPHRRTRPRPTASPSMPRRASSASVPKPLSPSRRCQRQATAVVCDSTSAAHACRGMSSMYITPR